MCISYWISVFLLSDLHVVRPVTLWFLAGILFVKQKTAYEMRISDWSSDVCSSDLIHITRKPPTRNEKVLKMKAVSAETSARAGVLASATAARARLPAASLRPNDVPVIFISLDPILTEPPRWSRRCGCARREIGRAHV